MYYPINAYINLMFFIPMEEEEEFTTNEHEYSRMKKDFVHGGALFGGRLIGSEGFERAEEFRVARWLRLAI